jgi:hypothetical protein
MMIEIQGCHFFYAEDPAIPKELALIESIQKLTGGMVGLDKVILEKPLNHTVPLNAWSWHRYEAIGSRNRLNYYWRVKHE